MNPASHKKEHFLCEALLSENETETYMFISLLFAAILTWPLHSHIFLVQWSFMPECKVCVIYSSVENKEMFKIC